MRTGRLSYNTQFYGSSVITSNEKNSCNVIVNPKKLITNVPIFKLKANYQNIKTYNFYLFPITG